jgi:alanine racemase
MQTPAETARAWVDIDRGALIANAKTLAAVSRRPLLPMVKADGYGLGAIEVCRALEPLAPWGFGVATAHEGAALRAAGIRRPIVVFTPLQTDDVDSCLASTLRPTIGHAEALEAWLARGESPFHLEIDTGMGRAGFRPEELADCAPVLRRLDEAAGWEGVFTHFHSADSDAGSVARQWGRFEHALALLPRRPPLVHAANSAAALLGEAYAGDLVRPGIFLYGGGAGSRYVPLAVARLQAKVVGVRTVSAGESVSYGGGWIAPADSLIATLGIGYADGVLRSLGNSGRVEINGELAPIAGRVTMDMMMIAPAGPVRVGDVATIFGGRISLDEQAAAAGTISYELLTSLGARVMRRYGDLP